MSEQTKTYTLTVGYREGPTGDQVNPDSGKTHTEIQLERFLSYIREHIMKADPADFSARVVSVEEQE